MVVTYTSILCMKRSKAWELKLKAQRINETMIQLKKDERKKSQERPKV